MSRSSKRSPKRSTATRLLPPSDGVVIRMYRQGLGDAFLLAFAGPSRNQPVYVLVDCGAHLAQPGGRENMRKVFDDVVDCTHGHVDVLIATHEHADHLSAFRHCAKQLLTKELTIGELWLAWTESDDDPVARSLRGRRSLAKQAIEEALARLKAEIGLDADEPLPPPREIGKQFRDEHLPLVSLSLQLHAAGEFFGFPDEAKSEDDGFHNLAARLRRADAPDISGNQLVLALLKECAAQTRYFDPGQSPHAIPGAKQARAYALGPPRDAALLRRSSPSHGRGQETFLTSFVGLDSFAAATVSLGDVTARGRNVTNSQPFDGKFAIPLAPAGADVELETFAHTTQQQQRFLNDFYLNDEPWRQIDHDWLMTAGHLALQLDRHTNNTSLAMAFEIGTAGTGNVLLFPGDAQIGSWLSWQNLSWEVGDQTLNAADLLRRTQVYKVSHHASHNATARRDTAGRDYGLSVMPEGLIALISVDEAVASHLPGWNMPYGPLYTELKRRARGMILRSDDADDELPTPRLRWGDVLGVPGARWRRSRKQKVNGGPLYYDLSIQPDT